MLLAPATIQTPGIRTVVLILLPWKKGMFQWCRFKLFPTLHKVMLLSLATFTSFTINSTNGNPSGLAWTTSGPLASTTPFVNFNWLERAQNGRPPLCPWETHVDKLNLRQFLLAGIVMSMELKWTALTRGPKVRLITVLTRTRDGLSRATLADHLSLKARSSLKQAWTSISGMGLISGPTTPQQIPQKLRFKHLLLKCWA